MSRPGTLYLVPAALGGDAASILPPATRARLFALTTFVVENAKSARQFLKEAGHPHPIRDIRMLTLDEHTAAAAVPELIAPLLAGEDCGLLSEAGCPAVADPGALLVRAAHEHGIRVVPLVGPSAIVMALMASGLNGQRFVFHGYLPVQADERRRKIQSLERASEQTDCAQIFIETPYRNNSLVGSILDACQGDTLLCIAADISMSSEWIHTRPVTGWRKDQPNIDRRPAVFLLYRPQKR